MLQIALWVIGVVVVLFICQVLLYVAATIIGIGILNRRARVREKQSRAPTDRAELTRINSAEIARRARQKYQIGVRRNQLNGSTAPHSDHNDLPRDACE